MLKFFEGIKNDLTRERTKNQAQDRNIDREKEKADFSLRLNVLRDEIIAKDKAGIKLELVDFEKIMGMNFKDFAEWARADEVIGNSELKDLHEKVSSIFNNNLNELEQTGANGFFRKFADNKYLKSLFITFCLFLKAESSLEASEAPKDKIIEPISQSYQGGGEPGPDNYVYLPTDYGLKEGDPLKAKEAAPNKEEMQAKLEEQRSFYLEFMRHPAYKKRLAKEMFGDKKLDTEMEKALDEEYKLRIKRTTDVNLNYVQATEGLGSESEPFYNKINTDPKSTYHELEHHATVDPNHQWSTVLEAKVGENERGFNKKKEAIIGTTEQLRTSYTPEDAERIKNYELSIYGLMTDLWEEIEAKYTFPDSPKFYQKFGDDKLHLVDFEDPEQYQRIKDQITNRDINSSLHWMADRDFVDNFTKTHKKEFDLIKEINRIYGIEGEYNMKAYYWGSTTEIKARVNSLRVKAAEEFGYDQNKEFHINDYPELKKEPGYINMKEILKLEDKDFDKLAKYIALLDDNDKSDNESSLKEPLA